MHTDKKFTYHINELGGVSPELVEAVRVPSNHLAPDTREIMSAITGEENWKSKVDNVHFTQPMPGQWILSFAWLGTYEGVAVYQVLKTRNPN